MLHLNGRSVTLEIFFVQEGSNQNKYQTNRSTSLQSIQNCINGLTQQKNIPVISILSEHSCLQRAFKFKLNSSTTKPKKYWCRFFFGRFVSECTKDKF